MRQALLMQTRHDIAWVARYAPADGSRREGGEGKVSGRDRCKGNIKIHSNTFTQPLALQVWQVSPSLRQLERTLGEFTQVA